MHGQRRVAPGTPQNKFASTDHANNRVVHMPDDRPIVDEKAIGDPPQALNSLSSSMQIGSSVKLPLVATISQHRSRSSKWCNGV